MGRRRRARVSRRRMYGRKGTNRTPRDVGAARTAQHHLHYHRAVLLCLAMLCLYNEAEEDFPGWAACHTSTGLWWHQPPEATSPLFWIRTESQQKHCCFSSTHGHPQQWHSEAAFHSWTLMASIHHPTSWGQKSSAIRYYVLKNQQV